LTIVAIVIQKEQLEMHLLVWSNDRFIEFEGAKRRVFNFGLNN